MRLTVRLDAFGNADLRGFLINVSLFIHSKILSMIKHIDILICENLRCEASASSACYSLIKKPQQNKLKGLSAFFMDCYLDAILMSLGVRNSKKRSNQPLLDS
jgi:hypothetical protein